MEGTKMEPSFLLHGQALSTTDGALLVMQKSMCDSCLERWEPFICKEFTWTNDPTNKNDKCHPAMIQESGVLYILLMLFGL